MSNVLPRRHLLPTLVGCVLVVMATIAFLAGERFLGNRAFVDVEQAGQAMTRRVQQQPPQPPKQPQKPQQQPPQPRQPQQPPPPPKPQPSQLPQKPPSPQPSVQLPSQQASRPPSVRPIPQQSTQPPLLQVATPAKAVIAAVGAVTKQITALVNANADPAIRGPVLGGIVRLAFHDAADFNGATGGADGCVDLTALQNQGLQAVVLSLAPVVTSVAGVLSQADVWALAASVAIQLARGPSLPFQFGRVTATNCGGTGSLIPDAEQGLAAITSTFTTRLNFTQRETAALMGAHVLGRALGQTSGYNGQWVPRNDLFTNDFFIGLLGRGWNKQVQPNFNGQPRTQWNGPPGTIMLNTDVSLAFDISSSCTRIGGSRAGPAVCPRSVSGFSSAVTEFAADNGAAFRSAFGPAFQKLMALGQTRLASVN